MKQLIEKVGLDHCTECGIYHFLIFITTLNFMFCLKVEAVGSEVTKLRATVDFSPKDHQLVVRSLPLATGVSDISVIIINVSGCLGEREERERQRRDQPPSDLEQGAHTDTAANRARRQRKLFR